MNRKEFLSKAFTWALGSSLELAAETPALKALESFAESETWERPPGAPSRDDLFLEKCTGCDACMIACPVNVIMVRNLERRDPVIYPEKDPCVHCDGYPCIQACETGALTLSQQSNEAVIQSEAAYSSENQSSIAD